MKTKSVKKILSIVIVSVVLLLTVATIILAVIPKKQYNPISVRDYAGVTVWRSTLSNNYYWNDNDSTAEANEVIDDLMLLIDESVEDNMLSSMFQGALGYNPEVTKTTKNTDLKSLYDGKGILCLVFNYLDDVQTLKIDNVEYKHETAFNSNTVEYNQIIMPITNNESYEECTLYLVKNNATEYKITYHAHQSEIYNYIINDEKMDWPIFESGTN